MKDSTVLVFDIGTQSVRGLLITPEGEVAFSAQDVYDRPYYSLRPSCSGGTGC